VPPGGGPLLWSFLSAIFLSQIFLAPGVAVADLLLAASALGVAVAAFRLRQPPDWPGWATSLAVFWAWAMLGGFLRSMRTPFGFSNLEFAKSLAKLTFYGVVAVLLAWGVKRVASERLRDVLLTLLAVNAGVAVLLYAAMLVWPRLPYERFLPGASSAYYFELRWFGDRSPESFVHQVFLRARGLSSEPSHLGYIQAMGLGCLLLGRQGPPRFDLRLALVLLSILLTFSLTAYGLLGAVLLLAAPRLVSGFRWRPRVVLLAGAVLCGVLTVPPVAQTLHRAIVVRATRLFQGKGDSSARLRLVESWSMAFRMTRDSPVVGTGLGNFESGLAAVRQDLQDRELLGPETQGWNVLAHVLAVTGVVGLAFFLLFLVQLAPGRLALAALFFLGCMVQGSFLAAPFWVYWVAYLHGE
jgi:O-antigen ligase